MNTSRLLAFSDGVIAIIITIMVMGIDVPTGHEIEDLLPLLPKFISYILSFIYVGLYWNNHHHMWQAATKVSGKILWANLNLLFWLSLMPLSTSWMGEHQFQKYPVAFFGFILLLCSISWYILAHFMKIEEGKDSAIYKAYKSDTKTILSMIVYLFAIFFSFIIPQLSVLIYWLIALIWIIPDKRIEKEIDSI